MFFLKKKIILKFCTRTLRKFQVFKTGFMVNIIELDFNVTENKGGKLKLNE